MDDDRIDGVHELLEAKIPRLAGKARIKPAKRSDLAKIIKADFELNVESALREGRLPRIAIGDELAERLGRNRSALIELQRSWHERLAMVAAMLVLELVNETRQFDDSFCLFELLDSRVGDDVHGAGVHDTEDGKAQTHWGPMLTTPNANVHVCLQPPADERLDERGFAEQAWRMLDQAGRAAEGLGGPRPGRILSGGRPAVAPHGDFMLPQLAVGAVRGDDSLIPLCADVETIRAKLADNRRVAAGELDPNEHYDNGFRRAVIQIADEPYKGDRELEWLEDETLGLYMGWAMAYVPLDLRYRTRALQYAIEHRKEVTLLHRTVKKDDPDLEAYVGKHASFALIGFDLPLGVGAVKSSPDLAHALVRTEIISGRAPARNCADRFGSEFAPAFCRGTSDAVRAFTCSARRIQSVLLSFIGAGYFRQG